ncbi:MAG: hypothetical protein ACREIC_24395, partial [Limisphaerales bacterium]
ECFPNGLSFYLGRTATVISSDGRELTSNYISYCLKKNALRSGQIVPVADFEEWLETRKTAVYLIIRQSDRAVISKYASMRSASVHPLSAAFLGVQLPAPRRP